MPDLSNGLLISELSWPELRDLKQSVDLVLLPVGSNEQHGPNLSLDMDIEASAEFCRRASATMQPTVAVAPPMPWGVSFHHMNFPGTITLSSETFIQVLVEVMASLYHHGFERFLIVNGHGGNIPSMNVAIVRAQEEIGMTFVGACSYFSFADSAIKDKHAKTAHTGHACEWETSMAMELAPQVVKHETLAVGELTELTTGFRQEMQKYGVQVPYRFDEFTRNGALGDATQATPEAGKEIIDDALTNFTQFCHDLIRAHPV
ncbi:MAG: creatininase family protein [Thermomicrobiaceae bacterium]